jgi:hypothetical protein
MDVADAVGVSADDVAVVPEQYSTCPVSRHSEMKAMVTTPAAPFRAASTLAYGRSRRRRRRAFGTPQWPADRLVPVASIEFEVQDAEAVAAAGGELQRAGFELLHPARTEPWGQTVTRLLTQDGLIVGISYAPSLHDEPA